MWETSKTPQHARRHTWIYCIITNIRKEQVKVSPAVMPHLVWDAQANGMTFDLLVVSDYANDLKHWALKAEPHAGCGHHYLSNCWNSTSNVGYTSGHQSSTSLNISDCGVSSCWRTRLQCRLNKIKVPAVWNEYYKTTSWDEWITPWPLHFMKYISIA